MFSLCLHVVLHIWPIWNYIINWIDYRMEYYLILSYFLETDRRGLNMICRGTHPNRWGSVSIQRFPNWAIKGFSIMKIAQKPARIMDDICTSVLGPQKACLQPFLWYEGERECMSATTIYPPSNVAGNYLNSFSSLHWKCFICMQQTNWKHKTIHLTSCNPTPSPHTHT